MVKSISSVALLLIGAASVSARSDMTSGTPPKPIGTIAELFGPGDYPDEARDADKSGLTVVDLKVGVDGKVSDCTVLQTSGSGPLDVATCRIAVDKARFTPATNAAGQPVVSTFSLRVIWDIPVNSLQNESSIAIATMDRGIVIACASEVGARRFPAPNEECQSIFQPADLVLWFGEDFVDAKELRFVNARRLGTAAPAVPGKFRIAIISEVMVQIGADRKVSKCTVRYPANEPEPGPCSFSGYKGRFGGDADSFTDLTYIAAELPPLPVPVKTK